MRIKKPNGWTNEEWLELLGDMKRDDPYSYAPIDKNDFFRTERIGKTDTTEFGVPNTTPIPDR